MKKNLISMLTLIISFAVSICVLAQEAQETNDSISRTVLAEQKLMVKVRLEIADGGFIHFEDQEGIMVYPQTVLTTLSPLMLIGSRYTIFYNGEMVPATRMIWNLNTGLVVLALIRPLPVNLLDLDTFLGDGQLGDNVFVLTSEHVIAAGAIQKEDNYRGYRRGSIMVDNYGRLIAMILNVNKNISGNNSPNKITRDEVTEFIKIFQQGPPIPELPKPEPKNDVVNGGIRHEI